jgi:hypothetical protein
MNPKPKDDEPVLEASDDDGAWEVISRYTRAQALEDGELVDVSEAAREVGIRFPVAVTRAVWSAYVALLPAAERADNDERGRLHDVVWMLRCGIARHREETDFLYVVTVRARPSRVQLRAICGPGDEGEPVITVLLPEED